MPAGMARLNERCELFALVVRVRVCAFVLRTMLRVCICVYDIMFPIYFMSTCSVGLACLFNVLML